MSDVKEDTKEAVAVAEVATPAKEEVKAAAKPVAKATTDEPAAAKPGDPDWLQNRLARAKETGRKEAKREGKAQRKEIKRAEREMQSTLDSAKADVAAAEMLANTILDGVPEANRAQVRKAGEGSVANLIKAVAMYQQSSAAARAEGVAKGAPPANPASAGLPLPEPANTAPAAAPSPGVNLQQAPLEQQYAQIRSISDPNKRESNKAQFVLQNADALLDAAFKRLSAQ